MMKYVGLASAAVFVLMTASVPQASARVCGAAAGPNGAVAACTHRHHHHHHNSTTVIRHHSGHGTSTTVIHRKDN
jgi:hypothetical protein